MPSPHDVRFAEFEVELDTGRLRHRGYRVRLQEKPFRVLAALLESPGSLVTRDELRERLWGGDTFVEFDRNLNTAVYKLREALADTAETPRFIETIPRKGYRFVGEVERGAPPAAADARGPSLPAAPRRTLPAVVGLLLALTSASHVAPSARRTAGLSANPAAREAYFKGRYLIDSRNPERLPQAIRYLEQATSLDAGFARAHAALADALYRRPGGRREAIDRARAAARRAVALDPGLGEAHHRLAVINLYDDWDWAGAAVAFERALAVDPDSALIHHSYAGYFSLLGRHERALAEMRRAIELDPASVAVNADAGWYEFVARRFDAAIAQCRRALELEPRHRGAHYYMLLSHLAKGERDEARDWAVRFLEIAGAPPDVRGRAPVGDADAGLTAFWEWRLSEALARFEKDAAAAADVALCHAALGETPEAIRYLEKAHALHSGWLVPFMRVYPPLDGLRSDARFRELERSLNLPG
jgi:DNA-binding winged helix-turn-helix (wHTH) protein/Tfp pilus assembly protein PilF